MLFKQDVTDDEKEPDDDKKGRGLYDDDLLDVDVFTVEEYRELFGADPEFLPGEAGFIGQN